MFLWVTLPQQCSAVKCFEKAIQRKVAIVPGDPFYIDRQIPRSTLRLNFSCSTPEVTDTGIARLGEAINELMQEEVDHEV
jgi:2-aminoadipate transaminase